MVGLEEAPLVNRLTVALSIIFALFTFSTLNAQTVQKNKSGTTASSSKSGTNSSSTTTSPTAPVQVTDTTVTDTLTTDTRCTPNNSSSSGGSSFDAPRWEAGGQATMVHLANFESDNLINGPLPSLAAPFGGFRRNNYGFGGRLGYNITHYLAVEGEVNFFPAKSGTIGGQMTEFLAGVKAGARGEHWGLFGKVRPGLMHFGFGDSNCTIRTPTGTIIGSHPCLNSTNDFALDVGGVLEAYPSSGSIIRLDVGNTLINMGTRNGSIFQNTLNGTLPAATGTVTTNNLQVSLGAGFRF
jgi:hypothetical protein